MALRIGKVLILVGLFPISLAAEPIHEAAASGDVITIERLLGEGIPVDQFDTTDPYGRRTTALYRATMAGRAEVVKLLLEAGADPTLRFPNSHSLIHPLQVAAKFGRAEILDMFLENGADPNAPGIDSTALHVATVSNKPEIVDRLIEAGALPHVEQPSIASLVSGGDPERGQQLYVESCRRCHDTPRPEEQAAAKDRVASLWGIVGREIASEENTIYSDAIKAVEGVWTLDRLNSMIALPGGFVPGTIMVHPKYTPPSDERDRVDLISYLRTLSDNPELLRD